MLLKGLPPDALLRTAPEDRVRDRWGVETELLAQLVEVVSVVAAERKIKDTVKVPRPPHLRKKPKAATPQEATARGIAVLRATSKSPTRPKALTA